MLDYEAFQSVLKKDLHSTIEVIVNNSPNTFGLALLLGEDINMMSPFLVTISEDQIQDIDQRYRDEAQYIPDEWPNWHKGLLEDSEMAFKKVFEEFKSKYPIENEDCTYTDDELSFMDEMYKIYIDTMTDLRKEDFLKKVPFTIIYTSDCDRPFMYDSVVALNSGIHRQKSIEIYKED
jgi:hypothetical protein